MLVRVLGHACQKDFPYPTALWGLRWRSFYWLESGLAFKHILEHVPTILMAIAQTEFPHIPALIFKHALP